MKSELVLAGYVREMKINIPKDPYYDYGDKWDDKFLLHLPPPVMPDVTFDMLLNEGFELPYRFMERFMQDGRMGKVTVIAEIL